jgi:hypothetical protein
MDLKVEEYVRMFSKNVLPILRDIAIFMKEDKSEKRGRYYFAADPSTTSFT